MSKKHHQSVTQAVELEALKAWKAFSLSFWAEPDAGPSGTQKSQLFFSGFLCSRWALYDFQEQAMDGYLSDFQVFYLQAANARYQTVLTDRMLCSHVMANYFYVPTTYCVINAEKMHWLEAPWWESGQRRPTALQLHTDADSSLQRLALPESSDLVGEQRLLSHLHEISRDQGAAITVSDAITAHPALAMMAEESFLYVVMARASDEGRPEPAAITLGLSRYSSRYGRQVLRVEEGALSASIDPETGRITACRMLNEEGRLVEVSQHPDSGIALLGEQLPVWENAREALMRFFDESSYLRYCHLTFVLTEQGLGFVSAQPCQVAAHQMHHPLLEYPGIGDQLKWLGQ